MAGLDDLQDLFTGQFNIAGVPNRKEIIFMSSVARKVARDGVRDQDGLIGNLSFTQSIHRLFKVPITVNGIPLISNDRFTAAVVPNLAVQMPGSHGELGVAGMSSSLKKRPAITTRLRTCRYCGRRPAREYPSPRRCRS